MKDSGIHMTELKVDGGACANDFLMAFQADILGVPVERPEILESTALGAAYLAGIGVGLWKLSDVAEHKKIEKIFQPKMAIEQREKLYRIWQRAVERSMKWIDE